MSLSDFRTSDVTTRRSGDPLFSSVLVANRGEIARRVFRTLRRLGIRSVAVYTDADADAPHAREADHAVRVASYLDVDAVIAAAVSSGADAVHPGYGFLSENAAFARACAAAGVVFVGPGVEALEVMGDKIRAKEHVAAHEVPTVPGFSAWDSTTTRSPRRPRAPDTRCSSSPRRGGGKGMTIATAPADLADALATARRVARAAFGDDTLLLERLLERPRHIEVQVLADAHGTTLSLGERECTLQRRHQKVIEEAPSPVVDAATRALLGEAAVAAARSVGYLGAGTVEFLVAGDRLDEPFFIEMNTRLQVEHPVTEMVTGIDLVEQQLRVAAGLPLEVGEIRLDGHAVEARVYAETPARGYLPATGTVSLWHPGSARVDGARVDGAVETGTVVSALYDPMIAKVIAHGPDRETALARLDAVLADTVVLGVDTNIADLRALLADPAVRAGDLDTGLLDRRGIPDAPEPSRVALAAVARTIADAAPRPSSRCGAASDPGAPGERRPLARCSSKTTRGACTRSRRARRRTPSWRAARSSTGFTPTEERTGCGWCRDETRPPGAGPRRTASRVPSTPTCSPRFPEPSWPCTSPTATPSKPAPGSSRSRR